MTVIKKEKLHWLDFPARVVFKLCLTSFRCLHGLAPDYLGGPCIPVSSVQVAVICALLPWVPWSSHLVSLLRSVSAHLLLHVRVPGTCFHFHLIYGKLISAFKPSIRSSRLSFSVLILNSSLTLRLSDSCLFLC